MNKISSFLKTFAYTAVCAPLMPFFFAAVHLSLGTPINGSGAGAAIAYFGLAAVAVVALLGIAGAGLIAFLLQFAGIPMIATFITLYLLGCAIFAHYTTK